MERSLLDMMQDQLSAYLAPIPSAQRVALMNNPENPQALQDTRDGVFPADKKEDPANLMRVDFQAGKVIKP